MTEIEYLKRENTALQAQIDRLMLEYCPDEMTSEQMANWIAHQRAVEEKDMWPEDIEDMQ